MSLTGATSSGAASLTSTRVLLNFAEVHELKRFCTRLILSSRRPCRFCGPFKCSRLCSFCHDDGALQTSEDREALRDWLHRRAASVPVHRYREFLAEVENVVQNALLLPERGPSGAAKTTDVEDVGAWVQMLATSSVCSHLRARIVFRGNEALQSLENVHLQEIVDACSVEENTIAFDDLLDRLHYVLHASLERQKEMAFKDSSCSHAKPTA